MRWSHALQSDAALKQRLTDLGLEPIGDSSEDFGHWIDAQLDQWAALAQRASIKAD